MLNSTQITIGNNSITLHGNLYSLTDLHKAAGGENRHKPSYFMQLESTKVLIESLENEIKSGSFSLQENQKVIKVVNGGNNQGTYGCKELLIAYAMWFSPETAIRILRSAELDSLQNVKCSKSYRKDFKTYILKNKLTNMLKIGKTTDFVTRRRTLERISGVGLELVALIDNDIEALLHEKFKSLKLFSEWFDASTGEIEEYVNTLTRQ
jgi:putative bacteriophage antirepressor|nr:MAG TPA: KilA-N domain [Caudoviricetes sp.]